MGYKPAQATPRDLPNFIRYAFRELTRIGNSIDLITPRVPTLNAEPVRPQEGDMVIADGVDWNPGSGNGVYIYLNSNWALIV